MFHELHHLSLTPGCPVSHKYNKGKVHQPGHLQEDMELMYLSSLLPVSGYPLAGAGIWRDWGTSQWCPRALGLSPCVDHLIWEAVPLPSSEYRHLPDTLCGSHSGLARCRRVVTIRTCPHPSVLPPQLQKPLRRVKLSVLLRLKHEPFIWEDVFWGVMNDFLSLCRPFLLPLERPHLSASGQGHPTHLRPVRSW